MPRIACGILTTAALIASALSAQAQATDPGVELAFMPSTMTVTLLNEGGKYVAVDLKHIPVRLIDHHEAQAALGDDRTQGALEPFGRHVDEFDLAPAQGAQAAAAFFEVDC